MRLALAFLLLAGCSSPPLHQACARIGATDGLTATLYFGRAQISDAAWDDFTARIVTPRLPDGFTVMPGNGQWMNPATHRISHEPSLVLQVAFDGSPAKLQALQEVAAAYKQEFHQQSVGIVLNESCSVF